MIASVKELKYLQNNDPNADSALHFFTHLILYSPLFPLVIFSNLDLTILFQKIFVEKKIHEKTKYFINISDPSPFTNIAQIQYIFLDKTGTVTKTKYKVSEVFFNNRLYKIDEEKLYKRIKQLPLTEKNKLFKSPFQDIVTNGEILYASQNFGNTIIDKTGKMSTIVKSPISSAKPLLKINEIQEEEHNKYYYILKFYLLKLIYSSHFF